MALKLTRRATDIKDMRRARTSAFGGVLYALVGWIYCASAQAEGNTPFATPSATATPACLTSEALKGQASVSFRMPETSGYGGHQANDGSNYRFYDHDCQHAANAGARKDSVNGGIVACNEATQNHTPGFTGHAFNWTASPVEECSYYKICLYNWGTVCCYHSQTYVPGEAPNLYEFEAGSKCTESFCGDQWEPGVPKALKPGELIENGGGLGCVKVGAGIRSSDLAGNADLSPSAKKLSRCKACCDSRLEGVYALMDRYWQMFTCEGGQMDMVKTQTALAFERCNAECQKYFGAPPVKRPIATPTQSPSSPGRYGNNELLASTQ